MAGKAPFTTARPSTRADTHQGWDAESLDQFPGSEDPRTSAPLGSIIVRRVVTDVVQLRDAQDGAGSIIDLLANMIQGAAERGEEVQHLELDVGPQLWSREVSAVDESIRNGELARLVPESDLPPNTRVLGLPAGEHRYAGRK